MQVFTCEYEFNKKRHLLTSLAASKNDTGESAEEIAMREGFRHSVSKMHKGKAVLDESTLKEHEYPHLAHAYAIEWAKTRGRPAPTEQTQAELIAAQFPSVKKTEAADADEDDE